LLLRSSKNLIDFLTQRSVQIRTTENVQTGLKVSNSSIVARDFFAVPHEYLFDGERGYHVTTALDGLEATVPVTVSFSDSRYAYIPFETDNLRINDILINAQYAGDTFTLYDKVTIRGVYRVNNGYAEFRRVNPDDELVSGGYTILNPANNPSLRAFDRIVTNGADVTDGQIIH
jgi:hypothetical protein